MHGEPSIQVLLEFVPGVFPPTGRIRVDGDAEALFTGWMELMQRVEALLGGAEVPSGAAPGGTGAQPE